MSKQWGHGFHQGEEAGLKIGEQFGEAKTQADLGMKALCLATAIRKAQKINNVSQYVLMEVLIDLLAAECGGRIDENESPNAVADSRPD
jgi:hypothetical protein